jgi:MarR family transcriptional regulator, 2-MHQ and catechol-resistance regulon repressor
MQPPARRRQARAALPVVGGRPVATDPALERDALELHRLLSEMLRMFQFRDRERICCHDISVTQCYALEALVAAGGITLNELAARLYLDKSTASRVVDSLVAKGYAERTPHPDDGRALALTPTVAGRRLYERIDGELLAEVRGVVAGFPPEVRRAMNDLLARFRGAAAGRILRGEDCCAPGCTTE